MKSGAQLKVLVSVYNISGYLIAELEALAKYAQIAVIETPCADIPKGTCVQRWINRTKVTNVDELESALDGFVPDVYLCGGWADKVCLALARKLKTCGTRTVLLIDTPWQGKLKQIVHCLFSRIYLTPAFDYAWGAGEPQERYLHNLGFSMDKIRRGYYCADTAKFSSLGKTKVASDGQWPHVFLYVGRYVAVKNMRRMEKAFLEAVQLCSDSDWKLLCIGEGELWGERTIHSRIEHIGYKRPSEIQNFVAGAGCFVLPSVYEPWGVVVHEAALMGLPMLCSSKIQAASAYLQNGENGFTFDPFSVSELASCFLKIMRMSDEQLRKMGGASYRLGMTYTIQDWAEHVLEFAK